MRSVRSTLTASVALAALALVAPNVAQSSGRAEPTAIAKAKVQLSALTEVKLASRTEAAAALAAPATEAHTIVYRLDAAFALISPAEDVSQARLPRSRPAASVDLVALAYAEEPAEAKERKPAPGMSAIEALVQQHAEANDVPPALAQALVQVESSFNPKATGGNGEIGLLQIKPQTARAMGYKGSAKGLYDAETNLAVGMKYLAEAHDRSGGDTCGTLLRYNSGLDAKRASKGSNKFCAKVKKVMAKRA